MTLKCLGSGSSGNCYILENDSEALIIEAGVPFLEVKKALNFNVRKIVGVVVSHSHGDHAKYVNEYEKAGIPVFKPYESEELRQVRIYKKFAIESFGLAHDVPCAGFYMRHPQFGRLLYASDTEYIKYRFKGLNHIICEANYSMEYVGKEDVNYEHRLRGHMSIDTTCEFLRANNNPNLQNVILCHLSARAADSEEFTRQARKFVNCPVYVAERGLNISLDSIPF